MRCACTAHGIVTFLFTDIEGSTLLWDTRPDDMSRALAHHDRIVRGGVARYGGAIFSTGGDGVGAAFQRGSAAIEAAVTIQRALAAETWPDGMTIRVRMGLHSGECEERDDDYFGTTVNEAARVMSVAQGGQIVVSAATANLLKNVELIDLGEHELKGLTAQRRLHQLVADGLPRDFPPLRRAYGDPGNLPVDVRALIGRDDAVASLIGLLRTRRLVTLTGMGGIGKTHLATHVADLMRHEFTGGIWMVDLAGVIDADAVAHAVATTLMVSPRPSADPIDAVAHNLAGRRVLLLLDNCEHVVRVVRTVTEALLARVDTLTVLATSRESLALPIEHLWPVVPLDVDGPTSSALALFLARAVQVVPDFPTGDPDTLATVAEIARRLEGVPLAVELAAARVQSMSPADVRDHLDHRFRLLSAHSHAIQRHQTLRHTVRWSFDLLTDEERTALAATSVFAGGFDLAGAVAVCGDGRDEYELLDLLGELVRKSLLHLVHRGNRTRYGCLEIIPQFADEQLAASGRSDERRRAHARHVLDHLTRGVAEFGSQALGGHLAWIDAEFDNVRAAHLTSILKGDLTTAAEIASGATILAFCLQRYEPLAWVEAMLPDATAAKLPTLPALHVAASFCSMTGRPLDAIRHGEAALELSADPRFTPTNPHVARILLARAHQLAGDHARAIEIGRELADDPNFELGGRQTLLTVAAFSPHPEVVLDLAEDILLATRTSDDPYQLANALWCYGRLSVDSDPAKAITAYREGLAIGRANHFREIVASLLGEAAVLEYRHGDVVEAVAMFDEALGAAYAAGDLYNFSCTIGHLVPFFTYVGQQDVAAVLAGWADRQPPGYLPADFAAGVAGLRSSLGVAIVDERAVKGASLDLAAIYRFARDELSAEAARRTPQRGPLPR